MLLWVGSTAAVIWSLFATEASAAGIILTTMTWVGAGFGLIAGWSWLRSDADEWQIWFLGIGTILAGAIVLGFASGIFPVVALMAPFYGTAIWITTAIERSRADQWRNAQRNRESQVFSSDDISTEPTLSKREELRMEDSDAQYPATLRELKARLEKSDGDPWK